MLALQAALRMDHSVQWLYFEQSIAVLSADTFEYESVPKPDYWLPAHDAGSGSFPDELHGRNDSCR